MFSTELNLNIHSEFNPNLLKKNQVTNLDFFQIKMQCNSCHQQPLARRSSNYSKLHQPSKDVYDWSHWFHLVNYQKTVLCYFHDLKKGSMPCHSFGKSDTHCQELDMMHLESGMPGFIRHPNNSQAKSTQRQNLTTLIKNWRSESKEN
jgi:hypothetical protein